MFDLVFFCCSRCSWVDVDDEVGQDVVERRCPMP